jgi:hypothetical protein
VRRGARWAAAMTLLTAPARADLVGNGQPIRQHDYAIDLAQTPVIAGSRVTGLAGAYVAVGEGVDGIAQNPGAVALRTAWSADHVDYDLGLGVSLASTLTRSDIFNSGHRTLIPLNDLEDLTFLNLAGNLQIGLWGFGLSTDLQQYSLNRSPKGGPELQQDRLIARFAITHATFGYGFMDGQLLIGTGARWSALDVLNDNAPPGAQSNLFEATGVGFEAGVLVRPNDAQFRLGACIRSEVRAKASPSSSVRVVYAGDPDNELYLPDTVVLPWELNLGFAVQLGKRPFNARWLDPDTELEPTRRYLEWRRSERERKRVQKRAEANRKGRDPDAAVRALDAELSSESALDAEYWDQAQRELSRRLSSRYQSMKRFHVLLSSSLRVIGALGDAVGVESFLERKVQRSGAQVSYSPRLGVETEAIPNWLRLRAGTYIEPTRFPDNSNGSRTHWTAGFDQRLFPWEVFGLWAEGSIWKIGGSIDVSREYLSWGVTIGMWH